MSEHRKFVEVLINDKHVKLQIDSASDITIISQGVHKSIGSPQLHPSTDKVISASKNELVIVGKFTANVVLNGRMHEAEISVCNNENLNLFGNHLMTKFGLWDIPLNEIACTNVDLSVKIDTKQIAKQLKSQFPRVFASGIGQCTKMKATLYLKPGLKACVSKQKTSRVRCCFTSRRRIRPT